MDRVVGDIGFESRPSLDSASFGIAPTLGDSQLTVKSGANDDPDLGQPQSIPLEDTLVVHVTMLDCLAGVRKIDSKSLSAAAFPDEASALPGPRASSIAELRCPSGSFSFHVPSPAADHLAEHVRERRVHTRYFRQGRPHHDPVIRCLTDVLLPALAKNDERSTLLADHLGRALRDHVSHTYGEVQSARRRVGGGLAPWQVRRAKHILAKNLSGELPLARIARECDLSARHFARAFRQSLGIAPHQWLLKLRLERAKEQLLNSDASLADIAVDCGFADQSHFTRAFTKGIGASPGQWRRLYSSGPGSGSPRVRNQLGREVTSPRYGTSV
jgi:AraC-like DNA-binding protein